VIKRYCGELEVGLHYRGRTPDNRATYLGYIKLPDGRRWRFAGLSSGVGTDGTRAHDFDSMAQSAVGFACYWTSYNRGDDTPAWAPPADLADAFDSAADLGEEEYVISRKPAAPA
jgi:hypothetical protein